MIRNNEETAVLVLDDEEIILKVLRRFLKQRGFPHVVTALNGRQALKLIQNAEKPFSLIISDQQMPEMTGAEFFKKVRELIPDTRRILMTGYSDINAAISAINVGAIHRYIQKPWENDELLAILLREQKLYLKIKEKSAFIRLTKNQNIRLFNGAKAIAAQKEAYKEEIRLKRQARKSLKKQIEELSSKNENMILVKGLESFLRKANVLNAETIFDAFTIICEQITQLIQNASKERVNLSGPSDYAGAAQMDHRFKEINDKLYEMTDEVIETACKLSEPALVELGIASAPVTDVDSYHFVPGIIELALAEGFMSQQAFDKALELLGPKDIDQSIQSIQKMLLQHKLISRIDLSATMVKRSFIETRLKDRTFAKELLAQGRVSEQIVNWAFVTQINRFVEKNQTVTIKDILAESDMKPFEDTAMPETVPNRLAMAPDGVLAPENRGSGQDGMVTIFVSEDKTKAYIQCAKKLKVGAGMKLIKERLQSMGIEFGIIDDKLLKGFLKHSSNSEQKFIVALGQEMIPGEDARIEYLFNTDYQRAGSVAADGTIDFCDRGDVPFVRKGDRLAIKTPSKEGIAGRDIFGKDIPLNAIEDKVLKPGKGVILSEDGLALYAENDGQPCCDALGNISVFQELTIKGDVDFETGHVNFHGNVSVSGCVKAGFKVHCANLTVKEIQGGVIDVSGDLNVSSGIYDSTVKTLGKIQTKFINNSIVASFGDVKVIREIIGSKVISGGKILNTNGRIISSTISAKMGMDLWQVGTDRSTGSILRAGLDDHTRQLNNEFRKKLNDIDRLIENHRGERQSLEAKNFILHKQIVDQSFAQEKMMKEMASFKKQCLEVSGKHSDLIKNMKENKKIEKVITELDSKIKALFADQDTLMKAIEKCEQTLQKLLDQKSEMMTEKDIINEVSECKKGNPIVKISNKIMAGTRIFGTASTMVVKPSLGTCTIVEIDSSDPEDQCQKKMVVQTGRTGRNR